MPFLRLRSQDSRTTERTEAGTTDVSAASRNELCAEDARCASCDGSSPGRSATQGLAEPDRSSVMRCCSSAGSSSEQL
jgi:hypothetical protein